MRRLARTLLALAAGLAVAPAAVAQASYPTKPVRIVVPFSTGTAADLVARQLAARLGEAWGQGVVVENQAGAAGNIGAAHVARAAPDGYTLLMMGLNHVINPSLYKDVQYDIPRDFRPIARVALAPLAIVANPQFAPNSIPELVAAAKARPDQILFGSGGSGSVTHLSFEIIKLESGIKMTHVPYKSIAPMLTDILGNQIPLGSPALASVVSHVRAGTLKLLAVTGPNRSSAFPQVPTVAEGGFPGYDVTTWNGVLAPARTPDSVIAKIHADVAKIVRTPEFTEALAKMAMEPALLGPSEFGAFLEGELAKWSKVVKATGAKVD
jgi:tripartite-type tricarboxylate transporter receptor subunit TctC